MTEVEIEVPVDAPKAAPAQTPAPAPEDGRLVSTGVFAGLSLGLAGVILVGLRVFVGVEFDAPTLALALTCTVMIWALRGMWNIVVALARPTVETLVVEAELGADLSTTAELREDKRRVLRAIKELEFDHDMGKLSDEDFEEISQRYKLRAIEIMRRLDKDGELHPLLTEHLRMVGAAAAPAAPATSSPAKEAS